MKQFIFYRTNQRFTTPSGQQAEPILAPNNRSFFQKIKEIKNRVRKSQFAVIAFSFVLLFTATSCLEEYFVSGNRSLVTETRYARNFDEIASGGEFVVNVVPGDEYSVRVTAESNLLGYIETNVVNGILKIRTQNVYNLYNHLPMTIDVVCPELDGLRLSGSGSITSGYFETDNFEATVSGSGKIFADIDANRIEGNVSGSGDIILTGTATETNFNISGSGKIRSYDLVQHYCNAKISGSGDMYVNVSKTLDATISGSGKIFYINNPSIHSKISGSGEVVNRN